MIKSIQLKEVILFKECLKVIKNESKFKYEKKINELIISEYDIQKYIIDENVIKVFQNVFDND